MLVKMGSRTLSQMSVYLRRLGLVATIGVALTACTGSDSSEEGDEPVQNEAGQDQADADGMPADSQASMDPAEASPEGDMAAVDPAAAEALSEQATAPGESPAADATLDGATTMPTNDLGATPEAPAQDLAADSVPATSLAPEPELLPADVGLDQNAGAGMVGTSQDSGKKHAKKSKHKAGSAPAFNNGESASYKVRAGDTLGRIAQKIYGSKNHWQDLAQANGLNAPYWIRQGQSLNYPLLNDAAKNFAAGGSGAVADANGSVTVKRGDTLSAIAARTLGSAKKWPVLFEQNKDKLSDPHKIEPGMVLHYGNGAAVAGAHEGSQDAAAQPAAQPAPKAFKKHKKSHANKKAPVGKNAMFGKKVNKKPATPKAAAQEDLQPATPAAAMPASMDESKDSAPSMPAKTNSPADGFDEGDLPDAGME